MWTAPGCKLSGNALSNSATCNSLLEFRNESLVSEIIDRLVLPQKLLWSKKRKLKTFADATDTKIGDFDAPSIIFATIANTYGDLSCVDISRDVSHAVCGFSDSVVRVYNLGNANRQSFLPIGGQNSWNPMIIPHSRNKENMIDSTSSAFGNFFHSKRT